ncbi:growth/differentiation factor 8-like [Amphiura filiformis]|uniref:growth/differentiation factor 8-like n=1 Tax=Amphiura filiformis TaxID=82378 RepID=UPI003B212BF4
MQLSTYCQNPLHCLTAILFLYFINMTNSAYLRGRRYHHRESHRNLEENPSPVVIEPSPPTPELQESSSDSSYSTREDEDPTNNSTQQQLCPSCQLREHQKALRIESIKRMILNKLRMTQAPNISRSSIPGIPPLAHLINNHFDSSTEPPQGDQPLFPGSEKPEHSSATDATTEKIITFAKRALPHVNQTACCYFNISHQLVGYSVSKATLYFYVNPAKVILKPFHEVDVKQVLINKSNRKPKGYVVESKKVELNLKHGEWMNVDFTNYVQEWAQKPETNLGIALELFDDAGNNVVVTDVSDEQEKKPFLQLRLRDERMRRSKRSLNGPICIEDDNRLERQCCRYPLEVDFSQFNWDWIIAPKNFEANYCSGPCPRMVNAQYPHTQIMSMVDPAGYSGPCCSASDMAPLTLLYFDDEFNIKYSELPNMRVESCGCA